MFNRQGEHLFIDNGLWSEEGHTVDTGNRNQVDTVFGIDPLHDNLVEGLPLFILIGKSDAIDLLTEESLKAAIVQINVEGLAQCLCIARP